MKDCDDVVNDLLERRALYQKAQRQKRKARIKMISSVSCLFLVFLAGIGIWKSGVLKEEMPPAPPKTEAAITPTAAPNGIPATPVPTTVPATPTAEPDSIITGFATDSSASYKTPENGEYFCFHEVEEARKECAGQNVAYLLVIDVFANEDTVSEEEKLTEYKRLAEEGFAFYNVSYWEYADAEGNKIQLSAVAVKVSEEQLQNFNPSEKYGYTFRFISNADISVEFDEENIISEFDSVME